MPFSAAVTSAFIPLYCLSHYGAAFLPSWCEVPFALAFLILGLFFLKKLVRYWRDDKDLAFFLVRPILQAQAGNRGEEMVLCENPQDPMRKKPITNLVMADFFLLVAMLFLVMAIEEGLVNEQPALLVQVFGLWLGLMFAFIACRINSIVIFYHRPQLLFSLTKHYSFWKAFSYSIPALLLSSLLLFFVAMLTSQFSA